MCLAIPGRVVRWLDHDPVFARAEIEFDGARRVCHMACVPDARVDDYVVVHAGVAISQIDRQAAQQTLADLRRLTDLDEELMPDGRADIRQENGS